MKRSGNLSHLHNLLWIWPSLFGTRRFPLADMDKGISVENPYAHVTIPRAQLKSSFVRNYLGEDFTGPVIANPAVVPTYPTYAPQEQDSHTNPYQSSGVGSGAPIRTQESWRRPYNPYASQKLPNGNHPTEMYTIDLDKRHKDLLESEPDPCCCACCCKCCPCCRKSCCVVS